MIKKYCFTVICDNPACDFQTVVKIRPDKEYITNEEIRETACETRNLICLKVGNEVKDLCSSCHEKASAYWGEK